MTFDKEGFRQDMDEIIADLRKPLSGEEVITEEIPDPCDPPCGWVHRRVVTPDQLTVEAMRERDRYCGLWWTLSTLATAIALGLGFGALAWLVLS